MSAKEAVLAALRKARAARGYADSVEEEAPVEQSFVEEQGGIY